MQKINSEKGITIVILVITVIILVLVSIPVIVNTTEVSELQKYTYFKGDIDKLRESIGTAYSDSQSIVTIGPRYTGDISFLNSFQNGEIVRNPNDGDEYYVISLKELNSHLEAQIDLKYGSGNKIEDYANLDINQGKNPNDTNIIQYEYQGNDTYIINAKTKTIYYTDGLEYKGEVYYRLPEDFTELSDVYIIIYDSCGGSNAPDMQTVEATGNATITLRDGPKKDGYVFVGWKPENDDLIYQAGAQYTVTGNTKLIAQWEEEKHGSLEIDMKITSSPTSESGEYVLGETVNFYITIKNNGNIPLKNIDLSCLHFKTKFHMKNDRNLVLIKNMV